MATIPNLVVGETIETVEFPNKTYKLDYENGRISGIIEGIEAVRQSVFKILNTERYDNIIYSWNYGVEFNSLIGLDYEFTSNDIQRQIKEALLEDDRILDVYEFNISKTGNNMTVSFIVGSTEGEFTMEVELNV